MEVVSDEGQWKYSQETCNLRRNVGPVVVDGLGVGSRRPDD